MSVVWLSFKDIFLQIVDRQVEIDIKNLDLMYVSMYVCMYDLDLQNKNNKKITASLSNAGFDNDAVFNAFCMKYVT